MRSLWIGICLLGLPLAADGAPSTAEPPVAERFVRLFFAAEDEAVEPLLSTEMKAAMGKLQGQADGKMIQGIVRSLLQ